MIAVDGQRLTGNYSDQLEAGHRDRRQAQGDAVSFTVDRNGQTVTITGNTFLDNRDPPRYRFGFGYDQDAMRTDPGRSRSSGQALDEMWFVTSTTVSHIAQIFDSENARRSAASSAATRRRGRSISIDGRRRCTCSRFISLTLGVINLFPFLPLDGGHIFWALAEKVRGKAIPFAVMERAGFVGLRAGADAVRDRPQQRHRANPERRLRSAIASPHGGATLVDAATIAEAFRLTVEDDADRIAVRTKDDEIAWTWTELRRR